MFNIKSSYSGLCNTAAQAWQLSKIIDISEGNLIICPNNQKAEEFYNDLRYFLPTKTITLFKNWEVLPYEKTPPPRRNSAERIVTLTQESSKDRCIISTARAICQKIVPPKTFLQQTIQIQAAEAYNLSELAKKIVSLGYINTNEVTEPGQFSWKGQVIDLFPISTLNPLRLEFNNQTLAKIDYFNPSSQRTLNQRIKKLQILPLREIDYRITESALAELIKNSELAAKHQKQLLEQITTEGLTHNLAEHWWPFITTDDQNALSTLFPNQLPKVFFIETEQVLNEFEKFKKITNQRFQKLKADALIPTPERIYSDIENILFEATEICSSTDRKNNHLLPTEDNREIRALQQVTYQNNQHPINTILEELLKKNYQLTIVAETELRRERIQNFLSEKNRGSIPIELNHLSAGFKVPLKKQVWIAESDLFPHVSHRQKSIQNNTNLRTLLNTLSHLSPGDYIIHEDYGRGIYHGLKKMTVAGFSSDFLQLQYADSTLYLPVQKIGRLQKYIAESERIPELDKLSSGQWLKVKSKVKKSIQILAGELLKLYALREETPGKQCGEFNSHDQDFADSFLYNETNDQLSAIKDVLADLTSGQVMERLVCGDVGFGKTEVAMRAAFKVASEGYQVAILAPTTLLVEQHYRTFQERFNSYPIRVAAISRFYSAKVNQEKLADLAAGKIDIIIGTHALLKNKNIFKNLALLVIDEEQRFGVAQKEKIKQMQTNIHVLSMSATPIPRTLYMSLIGVRKISTITTPPSQRLPVKTYLMNYSEEVIEESIQRELQRGGQVYFLHNQVKDLELTRHKLQEIVPHARIVCAHGQMPEASLEKIMRDFIEHRYDVLVTTTIIENGIDLPNANTMIIDRADKFGLGQLYQLRGRVGRSDRQAYTYLLVPDLKKITKEAKERLEAMQGITELGHGFQLAMRDLEIRGAGNILGQEQSGNINLIGYELYAKMLHEAIANLRTQNIIELIEPEIKISFEAYLPEYFIRDDTERIIIYQRIASQNSIDEIDLLANEIVDRFGHLPRSAEEYLQLMKFRLRLKALGISEVSYRQERLCFKLHDQNRFNLDQIIKACTLKPNKYGLSPRGIFSISCPELNYHQVTVLNEFLDSELVRRFA